MKKTSLLLTIFVAVAVIALIMVSLVFGKDTPGENSVPELISADVSPQESSGGQSESAEPSSAPEERSSEDAPDESEDDTSLISSSAPEPVSQPAASSAEENSSAAETSSEPKEEPSKQTEESSEPKEESSSPAEPVSSDPQPDGEDKVVHFLACPDNIIHPSVYYDALETAARKAGKKPDYSSLGTAEYDFSAIYENVASHIASADLAYINVETMIGGNENKISGYPMFNSPEAVGEYLVELGFDIMNVAHNHMLDSKDDKYLINCYDFFTERGKTVIGYYKNDAAVDNIVVFEKNGIKIALLAYTDSTNGIKLKSSSPTVIPYFSNALLERQIPKAKEIADIVIVSAHWGSEDSYTANSTQRTYAQKMIDLGVDVIVGMHPHCLQEMGWRTNKQGHKTLLVYSLGNFISGMYNADNMLGGMLDLDIVKDGKTGETYVKNVLLTPVVTHYTGKSGLNGSDTGHRNYKIYILDDYTEELAKKHQVVNREKDHAATLVGGKFCKANLLKTVLKYIPEEFLDECYTGKPKKEESSEHVSEPVSEPASTDLSAYEKRAGKKYAVDITDYLKYIEPGDGYLTLVNLQNPLSLDYVPADLVVSDYTRKDGRDGQKLVKTAAKALEALMKEAAVYGITDVTITSGYRSASYQKSLFNSYVEKEMKNNSKLTREQAEQVVLTYSMKPGCSEHQSGLCCDMHNLSSAQQKFGSTEAGKWLAENCWRFGFILRYPADKEDITGVKWEPWHFRFVGREAATQMHEKNMCLEEYVEYLKNN